MKDNGTFWETMTKDEAKSFLAGHSLGHEHPSRLAVKKWIESNKGKNKLSLLDIPCGGGVDYDVLNDIVDYTGMDRTAVLAETTKDKGANVVVGDIRQIPLKDGSYDIVMARAIFEHLPGIEDVEEAIKECHRVAKKYCIFSFFLPLQEEQDIRWNGAYFNNTYAKKDVEKILNSLGAKKVDHEFVSVEGTDFMDSYDIYYVTK